MALVNNLIHELERATNEVVYQYNRNLLRLEIISSGYRPGILRVVDVTIGIYLNRFDENFYALLQNQILPYDRAAITNARGLLITLINDSDLSD